MSPLCYPGQTLHHKSPYNFIAARGRLVSCDDYVMSLIYRLRGQYNNTCNNIYLYTLDYFYGPIYYCLGLVYITNIIILK